MTEYLARLASPSPTPGGGSAATIVAALGAALVAMAARITAGNKRYAQHHATAVKLAERADTLRAQLVDAGERDEAAFAAVIVSHGEDRQRALAHAAEEPLRAMELALGVQRLAAEALAFDNPHLASDLACASEFGAAALAASAYNVRVNHRAMHDKALVERQTNDVEAFERESGALAERVRSSVRG